MKDSIAAGAHFSGICARRCIIYIVRRTQLYLDDDLWENLHKRAKSSGSTISELARVALREKYGIDIERRKKAFEGIIGLWANRTDIGDTDEYVRKLRRDRRSEKITR